MQGLRSALLSNTSCLSRLRLNESRLRAALLLATWLSLSLPVNADSSGTAEGFAYAEDGAELLYTENHHWQGAIHTVEYFRPNGELIAVNRLDSSDSFVSPIYKQQYARSKFAEGARWRDTDLVLYSGSKEKVVEFQPPLVMSSGFYHFILEHWRDLQVGQSIAFDFAVPSRLTTVRLRMHALASGGASDGHEVDKDADPNWFYVRVEAVNALLRWLVQPLTVALDDKQRLVFYHGIANVRDEHGDTPQVLIRYRYPAPALSSNAVPTAPLPRGAASTE